MFQDNGVFCIYWLITTDMPMLPNHPEHVAPGHFVLFTMPSLLQSHMDIKYAVCAMLEASPCSTSTWLQCYQRPFRLSS